MAQFWRNFGIEMPMTRKCKCVKMLVCISGANTASLFYCSKGGDEVSKKEKEGKQPNVGVGYGEYYEDIQPIDTEELKAVKAKNNVWIKVGLLVFAVVLAIATCIVVMLLV